jgi:hypothetical protein
MNGGQVMIVMTKMNAYAFFCDCFSIWMSACDASYSLEIWSVSSFVPSFCPFCDDHRQTLKMSDACGVYVRIGDHLSENVTLTCLFRCEFVSLAYHQGNDFFYLVEKLIERLFEIVTLN